MGQGSARYNSITSQEKKFILESWSELRSESGLHEFGVSLFMLLLNSYPHFANYFPFAGNNATLEHFSKQFMTEFDSFVQHIHRPTKMRIILYANAESHLDRKIPEVDYGRLRKCILDIMKSRLPDTPAKDVTILAWEKVIKVAFSFIVEMTEDKRDEQKLTRKRQ